MENESQVATVQLLLIKQRWLELVFGGAIHFTVDDDGIAEFGGFVDGHFMSVARYRITEHGTLREV